MVKFFSKKIVVKIFSLKKNWDMIVKCQFEFSELTYRLVWNSLYSEPFRISGRCFRRWSSGYRAWTSRRNTSFCWTSSLQTTTDTNSITGDVPIPLSNFSISPLQAHVSCLQSSRVGSRQKIEIYPTYGHSGSWRL